MPDHMLLRRLRKHCWSWDEMASRIQLTHQTLSLLITICSDRCSMTYLVSASQISRMYWNGSINGSIRKIIPFFVLFTCCWKDGKEWWKTMENISINLYCINFFIVIKKIAKIDKNFRTNLILLNYLNYLLK